MIDIAYRMLMSFMLLFFGFVLIIETTTTFDQYIKNAGRFEYSFDCNRCSANRLVWFCCNPMTLLINDKFSDDDDDDK